MLLNLAYFGVEFAVALAIGSVSLFADSIDFLEDASLNFLILMALGWSALPARAWACCWRQSCWCPASRRCGPPGRSSRAGRAGARAAVAGRAGALAVNLACALLLAYRRHGGSLTRAAFLSARNDVLANVAIIAGVVTAATLSAWPDLVVGLGIALMNAGAAREVWQAARRGAAEAEA